MNENAPGYRPRKVITSGKYLSKFEPLVTKGEGHPAYSWVLKWWTPSRIEVFYRKFGGKKNIFGFLTRISHKKEGIKYKCFTVSLAKLTVNLLETFVKNQIYKHKTMFLKNYYKFRISIYILDKKIFKNK